MFVRSVVVIALLLAPLAAKAADEENPYKSAKVGDYAKYNTVLKTAGKEAKTVRTVTVTAAGEKEVSVKTTLEVDGKEVAAKSGEQKIDVTKPFDPGATAEGGLNSVIKWEKQKDGKEKLKVGDKEYECTWTTYKAVVPPNAPVAIEGELKLWLSKDVPCIVKRTLVLKVGLTEMAYTTELAEFGSSKK